MEPLDIIVAALVAGALAGLGQTAEQSVKDAYAGLKTLIQRRFATVNVDLLESDPKSKPRQDVIREDLSRTNAAEDEELLLHAQALLVIVQERMPETIAQIKINLGITDVSGSFQIKGVTARKGGKIDIRSEELSVGGDFEIGGISAGEETRPKDQGQ